MEQRFKSIYTLPASIEKLFDYLGRITKERFVVEYKNIKKNFKRIYNPPTKIVVSNNLFREYSCLKYKCSRCCWKLRDWNVFTRKQMFELRNKYNEESKYPKPQIIIINKKKFIVYVENNTTRHCPHLDKENNKCKIHIINPIHCALPLIKFKSVKGTTYITREYFGRNWLMKCPVKFKPMTEGGYKTTLFMLDRVKQMAEEYNIKTYIDDIINEVKEKWRKKKAYGKQTNLFTCSDAVPRSIQ